MYDTLYAILNKSEKATLQYFIFYEKVLDEKYLLKLNTVFQTNDSSKRHQIVSFDVMFLFGLKALFTEFCDCACAKRLFCLSEFVILVLH